MQYFVVSDEVVIANQIRTILSELHHECPATNVIRLDDAATKLKALQTAEPNHPAGVAKPQDDIVLLVLAPDPAKALMVVRDLHQRTATRILAVGQATDTKLVLHTIRDGASEYLDQQELNAELTEALQRINAYSESGRIIAVLAPGAGGGGSTVAVNVATALALNHRSCALIDLKLEAGDLAPLLDVKPHHTLSDLCHNVARMDYSLLNACLNHCASGLQLLAAPAQLADVPLVTPEAVHAILSLACLHFQFVVMDVDHTYRPEQTEALIRADIVLIVLRLDFISLRHTRSTLEFFKSIGVSPDRIRIIANEFGEPSQLTASQAEESLGLKIYHFIPDDPKSVNRANNEGIPVIVQSPSAKVSRSLVELADNLAQPTKPAL